MKDVRTSIIYVPREIGDPFRILIVLIFNPRQEEYINCLETNYVNIILCLYSILFIKYIPEYK